MHAIDKLVAVAEGTSWQVDWSDRYFGKLVNYITVFRLGMESIAGKRKMSQNKQADDRAGVISGLLDGGQPDQLAIAEIIQNLE